MKQNLLVSVITICFNSEQTIRKTIESVLKQTYKNVEYIIIDGNSTDSTVSIIKEYMPKFHGRLKWISEVDKGIYDAMNKGIEMANGSWIGIINSDDWYELNAIEKIINECEENVDEVIYGNGSDVYTFNNKEYTVISKQPEELSVLLKGVTLHHPSVFIKKEIYEKYGTFSLKYKLASDYELLLRLYVAKVKFKYVDALIANFRIGGASSNILLCLREYEAIMKKNGYYKKNKLLIYCKTLKKLLPKKILEKVYLYKWKSKHFDYTVKRL